MSNFQRKNSIHLFCCFLSALALYTLDATRAYAEDDCRLSLHLARFDKKEVKPPELSRNYSGLKLYGKPFLTRFDYTKTTVGRGEKENVLYLHLTAEGIKSLYQVTSTAIGFRIAALQGTGEKNKVVWVTRIRTGLKEPVIGVVMEKAQDASWLSYCLNRRIGGSSRGNDATGGKKKNYEF
jgi:hypothetical protein